MAAGAFRFEPVRRPTPGPTGPDPRAALGSCADALEQLGHSLEALADPSSRQAQALAAALAAAVDAVECARSAGGPPGVAGMAAARLGRRAAELVTASAASDPATGPALVPEVPRGLLDLQATLARRLRETARPVGRADPAASAAQSLDELLAAYRRHGAAAGREAAATATVAVTAAYAVATAGLATLVPEDGARAASPWPRPPRTWWSDDPPPQRPT